MEFDLSILIPFTRFLTKIDSRQSITNKQSRFPSLVQCPRHFAPRNAPPDAFTVYMFFLADCVCVNLNLDVRIPNQLQTTLDGWLRSPGKWGNDNRRPRKLMESLFIRCLILMIVFDQWWSLMMGTWPDSIMLFLLVLLRWLCNSLSQQHWKEKHDTIHIHRYPLGN